VSGAAVFRGCRMIKTPAELALMQVAADITVAALRYTHANVKAGMGPKDIGALMAEFTGKQGARVSFNLILIGEASAYPHGSRQPQVLGEGQVVLMDCGCNVGGYESDISRTFVFGEPTARQRKVWNDVARGQQVAFEAAQIGVEAGSVDRAVRAYYDSLGWGPRYKLPGLSHRTGHGIGSRHVLLRRARHLHPRRVRRAAGGLHPHDPARAAVVQQAADLARQADGLTKGA
jgi:Xaa-Pro dipeptidase